MEGMEDILAKLQAEQSRLEREKERIEGEAGRVSRELQRVMAAILALQGEPGATATAAPPAGPATAASQKRGRRPGSQLSPETKAKMAASQQARWARLKANTASPAKP